MTTKAQQRAAEIEARRQEQFEAKVRRLTGQLVSQRLRQVDVLTAYHAGLTAEDYAAQVAAREPVGRAVHALKADAVKAAADKARATIERVRAELEKAGWDINAAAPYPNSRQIWGRDYQVARAKYSLFGSLTEERRDVRNSFRMGEPRFVQMSEKGCDRFVAQAEELAAFEYDAFICKLVAKVGDCDDAELQGSHVWAASILTVRKGDQVERWSTKQIWNVSKLGNEFPQWPTRLMK